MGKRFKKKSLRKRNGIARALILFKPKVLKLKKKYTRKTKYKKLDIN